MRVGFEILVEVKVFSLVEAWSLKPQPQNGRIYPAFESNATWRSSFVLISFSLCDSHIE